MIVNPSVLMFLYLSSLKNAGTTDGGEGGGGGTNDAEDRRLAKIATDSGMLLSMYLSALQDKNQQIKNSLEEKKQPSPPPTDLTLPKAGPVVTQLANSVGPEQRGISHLPTCCQHLALHSSGSLARSPQKAVIGSYGFVGMAHDNLPIYKHSPAPFMLFYNDATKHWQVSQKLYQKTAYLITYGSVWCPEYQKNGWHWYDPHSRSWVLDTTARFYCH